MTPTKHEDARVWRRLVAGGGSALTAVLLTYPLDLIQTNITVQTNNERKNNSISSTFRRIYGENVRMRRLLFADVLREFAGCTEESV